MWGEPPAKRYHHVFCTHFNSLAPCGANLILARLALARLAISTHSPRAGRTGMIGNTPVYCLSFQLTRPVRGEPYANGNTLDYTIISTHSPRAGRTNPSVDKARNNGYFNSLAPCGANRMPFATSPKSQPFQLTRPVRGEPAQLQIANIAIEISTHSPRAGRTLLKRSKAKLRKNFNSLAPCGANLCPKTEYCALLLISTHSPRAGRTKKLA